MFCLSNVARLEVVSHPITKMSPEGLLRHTQFIFLNKLVPEILAISCCLLCFTKRRTAITLSSNELCKTEPADLLAAVAVGRIIPTPCSPRWLFTRFGCNPPLRERYPSCSVVESPVRHVSWRQTANRCFLLTVVSSSCSLWSDFSPLIFWEAMCTRCCCFSRFALTEITR